MSAGPSRARVTARLAQLQDAYDGFDVRQTTVSVAPTEFERAVEGSDVVARAAVRVRDAEGRYLVVPDADEWVDPGGPIATGQSIVETAVGLVQRQTGVTPHIDELDRVSIVCVNSDEPADEPLYQLHALFRASPVEGEVRGEAAWREEPPFDVF